MSTHRATPTTPIHDEAGHGRTPARAMALAGATLLLVVVLLGLTGGAAHAVVPTVTTIGTPTTPTTPTPPPMIGLPTTPDPPAPTPTFPLTPGEQPPKLDRIYSGDDGSALYLRAIGGTVVGYAEHPGPPTPWRSGARAPRT